MFLSQLSEKEKNAFISLSVHASNSNGIFADEEKVMIQEYCKEMGIPFFDANNAISMDEVVDVFKASELQIKKIVLLELISVGYASGDYCDKERAYLRDVAEKIGVDSEKLGQIEDWVQGFISHIGSGASIVNN